MNKSYYNLALFHPHNGMRVKLALEALLNNLDKVSVEDIEKLTEDL